MMAGRKLPILGLTLAGIAWAVFIWVNSTINTAPFSKIDLTALHGILFLFPLAIALMISIWLFIHHVRRSLLASLLIVGLLGLKLYSFTSPVTVLALFSMIFGIEWYMLKQPTQRKPKSHTPIPFDQRMQG